MEFKDKLLYVRAKLNLSQTELAKALGVSFQTINRWERNKVKPTEKAKIQFGEFCAEKNIVFKESGNMNSKIIAIFRFQQTALYLSKCRYKVLFGFHDVVGSR